MKTCILLLFTTLLISCYAPIRKIDDSVRNEVTYAWQVNKYITSKLNRTYRSFSLNIRKKQSDSKFLYFNVNSSFPITQYDYFDSVYLVLPNTHFKYKLEQARQNIEYKEKIDEITTTSNTKTDVKVENTTTSVPVTTDTNSTEPRTQEQNATTDTQTTTSTSTDTDTKVNSEILDKVNSERLIRINVDDIKLALKYPSMILRLYSEKNDDFWDIKFSSDEVSKIRKIVNHQAETSY